MVRSPSRCWPSRPSWAGWSCWSTVPATTTTASCACRPARRRAPTASTTLLRRTTASRTRRFRTRTCIWAKGSPATAVAVVCHRGPHAVGRQSQVCKEGHVAQSSEVTTLIQALLDRISDSLERLDDLTDEELDAPCAHPC